METFIKTLDMEKELQNELMEIDMKEISFKIKYKVKGNLNV